MNRIFMDRSFLHAIRRQRYLMRWAATITDSPAEKRAIVRDYKRLHKSKGLSTAEYYQFEFEIRSETFRQSFLGLHEQRYYLDYLNPLKYYSLARNKYIAHKMLERAGVRKSELYCYYQPEARYTASDENASDLAQVLHILKQKNVRSCVI